MRSTEELTGASPRPRRRWYAGLGFQVVVAMAVGVVVGLLAPGVGASLKILGDLFLALVKAGVGPLVFLTITTGIAAAGDLRKASRIGLYGLVYFEVLSTVALLLGLASANLLPVGVGVSAPAVSSSDVPDAAAPHGFVETITAMVPDSFVGAFTSGQLLQVVVLAVLFGVGLLAMPERYRDPVNTGLDVVSQTFFAFVGIVMRLAPVGAFGAIAYAVGTGGGSLLLALGQLIVQYWITVAFFFFGVLGLVLAVAGVNIFRLLRHLKLEMTLTLGTGSSESALPGILDKLPRVGVSRQVTGLVVPTGYAFNLDGTSIYMTVCTLFLAHLYGIHLGLPQQLGLLALMLLTSKGAATVSGGTFVVFAATVTATGYLPVAGLPVLFGVYQFMTRATATLNTFGNVVAAVVVARLTGEFDTGRAGQILTRRARPALDARAAETSREPATTSTSASSRT